MNSNSFWTEGRIARLKELRTEGLSHHAIAVRMTEECGAPVTDGMVQHQLRILTKAGFEKPQSETWTDERVDLLKKLWSEGFTAGEIGKQIGMTRCAVIGKKTRLGLPGHGGMVPVTRLKPPSPVVRKPAASAPRPVARSASRPPVLISNPVSIVDIAFLGQCKWPLERADVTGGFLFCGGKASTRPWGKSACPYCAFHADRALNKKEA